MKSTKTQPKRRIHQNIWGNWNGYEGSRRIREFGTDGTAAALWLSGSALDMGFQFSESGALVLEGGLRC